ncbi:MAG: hypothetical protein GY719_02295 [bacterium]|nr:hypothetical protein [bacterium]
MRQVARARAALLLALAPALTMALAAATAASAKPEPEYSARLRMPSRVDRLGVSRSVVADLHTGEVFVCDSRKQRIVIFDRQGLFLYQIPGGDNFSTPVDLAVDPDGYLLALAWSGGVQRLLRLDFDGKLLGQTALSGFPEDAEPPNLVSIALPPAGDRLFALDQANQRMWIADRQGAISGSVDLATDLTEKEAREFLLGHVDVYGDTVLVALPTAGRVRLYDLEGRSRGAVGLKGTAPCQTAFPVAAALGSDGNVVIVDRQRMLFMVWDPESNRCLGEYSGIGNAPGRVYQPADLALDGEGRIYVSQGFEGRVQVFAGGAPAAGAPVLDSGD